jgi:hypothetical protein
MLRLRSWSLWLLLAIAIGIFQSQPEIAEAIAEGGIDYAEYAGPLWIKALKDIFTLALWMYLLVAVRDPFPARVRRLVAWCYAIVAIAATLSAIHFGALLMLAGLRWIIPLFVLIEMRRLCGVAFNERRLVMFLLALLGIGIALQIARTFYFPPIWGERWGLSARPPAYFLLPNTNAFFATACAAITMDITGRKHRWAMIALVLSTASATLSQSGGGMMACCVLWLFMILRRAVLVLPVLAIVGTLFLSIAPTLLGRDNFVDVSGGERVDKLSIAAGELAGTGAFGAYTNTGFMLLVTNATSTPGEREAIISDSFYASLLGNFGVLSIPFTVALLVALRQAEREIRRSEGTSLGYASLLCLATFGFSTVVSEAFPMVIMLGAGIWMRPFFVSRSARAVVRALPASA